jgi:hypothetical protein
MKSVWVWSSYHGLTDAVLSERVPAALSMAYGGWSRFSPASLGGERLAWVAGSAKITALWLGGCEVRGGGKFCSAACSKGLSQGSVQNYPKMKIAQEALGASNGDHSATDVRLRVHSCQSKRRQCQNLKQGCKNSQTLPSKIWKGALVCQRHSPNRRRYSLSNFGVEPI